MAAGWRHGRSDQRIGARTLRLAVVGGVAGLALAACGAGTDEATVIVPASTLVVPGSDPVALAIATSQTFFERSPAVVVTSDGGDPAAAAQAAALGVPLLQVPGEGVADEVARLGAGTAVAYGSGAADWATGALDIEIVTPSDGEPSRPVLDAVGPPSRLVADTVVLAPVPEVADTAAAAATATAAGAEVVPVTSYDPRADARLVAELSERSADDPAVVVGLGSAFGSDQRLADLTAVASTGVQLPGGGQLALPGKTYVALYGHPDIPALGSLGEQGVDETVERTKEQAAAYEEHAPNTVVPTFEIIATIAARDAGADGDYSSETPVADLRPLVEAAGGNGISVLLDLQPGRADFLSQAKLYAPLLELPYVGLALDPEWRLKPDQKPLEAIGSVTAAEVNSVITWLAKFTRERALPQKMLVVHQFRLSMIRDRDTLDTGQDEVAVVLHVDGFGTPAEKRRTWAALTADPPAGAWFAWKNFYDEDRPTWTPEETMAVRPTPVLVSYQ